MVKDSCIQLAMVVLQLMIPVTTDSHTSYLQPSPLVGLVGLVGLVQRIRFFTTMCHINRLFTYLLTWPV